MTLTKQTLMLGLAVISGLVAAVCILIPGFDVTGYSFAALSVYFVLFTTLVLDAETDTFIDLIRPAALDTLIAIALCLINAAEPNTGVRVIWTVVAVFFLGRGVAETLGVVVGVGLLVKERKLQKEIEDAEKAAAQAEQRFMADLAAYLGEKEN